MSHFLSPGLCLLTCKMGTHSLTPCVTDHLLCAWLAGAGVGWVYSGVQAEAYPQGALLCCLLVLASRLMYTGGLWRTVEVGRTPWAGLSPQVEYSSYFDEYWSREDGVFLASFLLASRQ